MAKASAQITLHYVIDIQGTYRYYLLQSSTSSKPSKPTTYPPSSSWNDTEPTYTSGSTNSLYFVDCTVLCDGSFEYSDVSLSSAYEAAKEAYNKAQNAQNSVDNMEIGGRNYFIKAKINNLATSSSNTFVTGDSYKGYSFATSPGEEWTLYRTGTTNNRWRVYWSTEEPAKGVSILSSAFSNDSQDAKVINHLVAPENANYGFIYLSTQNDEIPNIMLEKGNKATDWKPAPEDVDEKIDNVQDDVNDVESRIGTAELDINALEQKIVSLVIDDDGTATLTQTGSGWSFDIESYQETLDSSIEKLNDLSGTVDGVGDLANQLNTTLQDIANRTSYIDMKEDENGDPYLELGKRNDSDGFKVRITPTALKFMQGSTPVAYISNKTLYIEKAIIKNELHIGEGTGFVFAKRANGNMGIRWKESD